MVMDTDVASLTYKGRVPPAIGSQLLGHELRLTFVTVGELARWADKRQWGARGRTALGRWIGQRLVLPYAEEVAWTWGRLSVESERRGRPRPVNDMWIASCCIVAGLPLATRNVKDFGEIAERHGLTLITD
jgi:toxin FitB